MPWGQGDPAITGRPWSAIFREWLSASLEPRAGFNGKWNGPAASVFMAALFDNTITPDERVPAAQTAYGSGEWDPAGEVSSPGTPPDSWPAGGLPLEETGSAGNPPATGFDSSGILVTFRALPTGTGTGLVTLANVFGDLLYTTEAPTPPSAGTPQDQGCAFHYFGGVQQVSSGTFTIVWNPDGVMRVGVGVPIP